MNKTLTTVKEQPVKCRKEFLSAAPILFFSKLDYLPFYNFQVLINYVLTDMYEVHELIQRLCSIEVSPQLKKSSPVPRIEPRSFIIEDGHSATEPSKLA